jgi:hypothetical protein
MAASKKIVASHGCGVTHVLSAGGRSSRWKFRCEPPAPTAPPCGPMQRSRPRLGGCEPFPTHIPPAPHADGRSLAWIWRGGQERNRKYRVRKRIRRLGSLGRESGTEKSSTMAGQGSEVPEEPRLPGSPALPDHHRHRNFSLGEAIDSANPASTSAGRMLSWPSASGQSLHWQVTTLAYTRQESTSGKIR